MLTIQNFVPLFLCLICASPMQGQEANSTQEQVTDTVGSIWQDPAFKRRVQASLELKSEVEPSMTEEERTALAEIVEKITAEDMDAALDLLAEHLGPNSSAQFDYMKGYVLYFTEDLEGATAAFQSAVEKFPNFLRAWTLFGQVQMQLEDYAAARVALSQALQIGGASADLYGVLGFAYSRLEDHMSAESCYRMATVLDPDSEQWKEGLAIAFFLQGKNADLVSYTTTLLKSRPDSKRLLDLQAKAYIRLEKPLLAAQNFELLEMMGHADFQVLASLADIYVNEQLFELATSAYSRALAFESQAESARPMEAAKVMVANSAYDSAMILVDSVELTFRGRLDEETEKDIWKLRALTASLTDQLDAQLAALKQIIAVDPLDGQALLKLGRLYLQSGSPDEAILYFERAEGIEKTAASAKLGHAQALVAQEKFNEAVPILRSSLALEEREPVRQYLRQIESLATGR